MKRLLLTGLVALCAVTTLMPVHAVAQVLLDEDFDSYSPGGFPVGWTQVYSGAGWQYQVVTDEQFSSPPNSFTMRGLPSNSAVIEHEFTSPPATIECRAMMRVKDGSATASIAELSLWNGDEGSWGVYYCRIMFDDTAISLSSSGFNHYLMNYQRNRWYDVKVEYDANQREASVWIDGVLMAFSLPLYDSGLGYKAVALCAGHGGIQCYFDDILCRGISRPWARITLDDVTGLNPDNSVNADSTVRFTFRLTYAPGDGSRINGSTNGFQVYTKQSMASPGTPGFFDPISYDKLPVSPSWSSMYDGSGGIIFDPRGIDGLGADTIGFGGYANFSGIPDGFSQQVWWVETTPRQGNDTLCVDSCFYPPSGFWQWNTTRVTTAPAWGGPYCFEIVCCAKVDDVIPDANSVGVDIDLASTSGVTEIATTPDLDFGTVDANAYKVCGSYGSYYSGSIVGATFNPNDDFFYGEVVTVTMTNQAQCPGGRPFVGYSWQFTCEVDPNSPGTFVAQPPEGVGYQPLSVIAADLNGDGDLDLAVANYGNNNVSILLGNGDGSFAAQPPVGVGTEPRSVIAADLNGDGDLDLAVANWGNNNVSILLGNGDGSFAAQPPVDVGTAPLSLIAADLDGDGDLDLAVVNNWSLNVSILLGNGDGSFTAQPPVAVGYDPYSLIAADLDGDGNLDLAVTIFFGGYVSILLGNGDGSFSAQPSVGVGHGPWGLAAADLDGDGDLDLAVANYNDDYVSILLGNGDGSFSGHQSVFVGDEPSSVIAADLDGDGDLDLAVTNYNDDNVSILLGNGDGSFTAQPPMAVGGAPYSVIAADLDGDGDLDLAVTNYYDANVSILLNSAGCCNFRGDVDHSGVPPVDIADLVYLVDFMFNQGPPPVCFEEGDIDGSGVAPIDIADLVYLVDFMFNSGPAPPPC